MKYLIRMFLCFFLISSNLMADQLEIKVGQNSVNLPYWPAYKEQYGAVLMVRGGEPPQWSELLADLAKQLAQNGWSVVLLNCKNNSISWLDQLPEAISALRKDKNKRIILLHYGGQLNLSLDYFSKPQAKMINGLVLLSAYDSSPDNNKFSFRFPIVDVTGQFDYDRVRQQMQFREKEYRKQNYLAVEMPGADHEYEYGQQLLVSYVHGWMAKLPETRPQPRPIISSYIEPVYSLQSAVVAINNTGLEEVPELQEPF